jgi:hypothetical protein
VVKHPNCPVFINMDRCFWKERLSGVSVYKNDPLLTHHSVTFMVGPHLEALYKFWRHTNDATERKYIFEYNKQSIFLKEQISIVHVHFWIILVVADKTM